MQSEPEEKPDFALAFRPASCNSDPRLAFFEMGKAAALSAQGQGSRRDAWLPRLRLAAALLLTSGLAFGIGHLNGERDAGARNIGGRLAAERHTAARGTADQFATKRQAAESDTAAPHVETLDVAKGPANSPTGISDHPPSIASAGDTARIDAFNPENVSSADGPPNSLSRWFGWPPALKRGSSRSVGLLDSTMFELALLGVRPVKATTPSLSGNAADSTTMRAIDFLDVDYSELFN